jgi:hypothetical protein
MRPRFGPAIASRSATHNGRAKPLDASGGGVFAVYACCTVTPIWNAIGLSLPVVLDARDAIGSLSPWHSFLPPRGGGDSGMTNSGGGNQQKKDVSPRKWGERGEFRHCSVTLWLSILGAGT